MILHLNDDHHWTREVIATWVAPPENRRLRGMSHWV